MKYRILNYNDDGFFLYFFFHSRLRRKRKKKYSHFNTITKIGFFSIWRMEDIWEKKEREKKSKNTHRMEKNCLYFIFSMYSSEVSTEYMILLMEIIEV